MIRGILWDNDGVLVDSEQGYFEVNREFFATLGIELTEKNYFDWFMCDNRGAWHLLSERGATPEQVDAYRRRRNALYAERLKTMPEPATPGASAALARLGARVPMGVVTSSRREHFDAIHDRLDLVGYFRFVLTIEDYQNSKPAPDPYLLGLRRLGVSAGECLAIEDSPRGLQSALAAGIRCLVLRRPMMAGYPFAGALRVVGSMPELADAAEALMEGGA